MTKKRRKEASKKKAKGRIRIIRRVQKNKEKRLASAAQECNAIQTSPVPIISRISPPSHRGRKTPDSTLLSIPHHSFRGGSKPIRRFHASPLGAVYSPANRRTSMYVVDPKNRITIRQPRQFVNSRNPLRKVEGYAEKLTCKTCNGKQDESHVSVHCGLRRAARSFVSGGPIKRKYEIAFQSIKSHFIRRRRHSAGRRTPSRVARQLECRGVSMQKKTPLTQRWQQVTPKNTECSVSLSGPEESENWGASRIRRTICNHLRLSKSRQAVPDEVIQSISFQMLGAKLLGGRDKEI